MRRGLVAAGVAAALGVMTAAPAAAAEPRPPDGICYYHKPEFLGQRLRPGQAEQPGWVQEQLRWADAQQWSDGSGVRVAVVDSGIDARLPQLRGKVLGGADVTSGRQRSGGTTDCVGHGTAVAGLIAARPVQGNAFFGVAPGARLVPVRETWGVNRYGQETAATADALLGALQVAIHSGARIVNVSVTAAGAQLRPRQKSRFRHLAAVAARRKVLIVAASGNRGTYRDQDVETWPAALARTFPNVVAVGGSGPGDAADDDSIGGPFVTVAAPAVGVVSTMSRVNALFPWTGTSFATPIVSGVAALILSRTPSATPAQIKDRLIATADPPPGGGIDHQLGHGVVNPVAAVTSVTPDAAPATVPGREPLTPYVPPSTHRRNRALALTGGALALAVLLPVGALTLRRGRSRRWQVDQTMTGTAPR